MIIGLAIPDSSSPSESASSALASPKPHSSGSFAQYLDRANVDAAKADDAQAYAVKLPPRARAKTPADPQRDHREPNQQIRKISQHSQRVAQRTGSPETQPKTPKAAQSRDSAYRDETYRDEINRDETNRDENNRDKIYGDKRNRDSKPEPVANLASRKPTLHDRARSEARNQSNSVQSTSYSAIAPEATTPASQPQIAVEQRCKATPDSTEDTTTVQGQLDGLDSPADFFLPQDVAAPFSIPQDAIQGAPTAGFVGLAATNSAPLQGQGPELASTIHEIARPSIGTIPQGQQVNEPAVATQSNASLAQDPSPDPLRTSGSTCNSDSALAIDRQDSFANSRIDTETSPEFQATRIGQGTQLVTTAASSASGLALNGLGANGAGQPPLSVASETGISTQTELNPAGASPSNLVQGPQAGSPSSELNASVVSLSLQFNPNHGGQQANPTTNDGEVLQPLEAASRGRGESHPQLGSSNQTSSQGNFESADGSDVDREDGATRSKAQLKISATSRQISVVNTNASDKAVKELKNADGLRPASATPIDENVERSGLISSDGGDSNPGGASANNAGPQHQASPDNASHVLESQSSTPASAIALSTGGESTFALGGNRARPAPTIEAPNLARENSLAKPLPASVNQLRIEIPIAGANGAPDEKLQIHFSQRNAGLNLGIQANNGDLNLELRDALPELLQKLKTGGWQPQSGEGLKSQLVEGTRKLDAPLAMDHPAGEARSFGQSRESDSSHQSNEKDGGRQSFGGDAETASRQQDNRRDRRGRQRIWNRSWDGLSVGP